VNTTKIGMLAPNAITNEHYSTLRKYPINVILGSCLTAAPGPARDNWCAPCGIETQPT